MSNTTHHFHVGTFECTCVLDGIGRYPPQMFFLNLPKEHYEPELVKRGYSSEQMDLPIICLVIKAAGQRILVDTGAKGLAPDAGRLFHHLRAEGLDTGDIDIVVISHAHGDHIAGNLLDDGTPAFPRARYVMLKEEWDFWMSSPKLTELPVDESMKERMVAMIQRNLAGVQKQLDLVKPETEISPGISIASAFGHTPGHAVLDISSEGERLIFAADAIIDPIDVEHPETRAIVDHQPEVMVRTRLQLLQRAARENAIVSASHFPFPGLGYIVESGHGWRWQPA
jgi:glyoxylase-like metal-dependent hydrolase (beta-lactamase superfamily II)